jgi:excisionase family DNA binding protein
MDDSEVMTVDDVAEYLKLHKQTVSKMAQRGKLPGVLIANRWRFKRDDVEAMLNTTKDEKPKGDPANEVKEDGADSYRVGVEVTNDVEGRA